LDVRRRGDWRLVGRRGADADRRLNGDGNADGATDCGHVDAAADVWHAAGAGVQHDDTDAADADADANGNGDGGADDGRDTVADADADADERRHVRGLPPHLRVAGARDGGSALLRPALLLQGGQ